MNNSNIDFYDRSTALLEFGDISNTSYFDAFKWWYTIIVKKFKRHKCIKCSTKVIQLRYYSADQTPFSCTGIKLHTQFKYNHLQ